MKRQKGYMNIDFTGSLIFLGIISVIIGVILANVVPWIWGFIEPLIHGMTAHNND